MKDILLFLVLLLSSQGLLAQSGHFREGKKHFARNNYIKTINHLEKARDLNLRAKRRLIQSYLILGHLPRASHWLQGIYTDPKRTSEDLWEYAQVLMQLQRYDSAHVVFDAFFKMAPQDQRARAYRNAGDFHLALNEAAQRYKIRWMDFNQPDQDDFAPMILGDWIIFTSNRRAGSLILRNWGNNTGYTNLFKLDLKALKPKPLPFHSPFNAKHHNGPITFSKDGTTCILTKSNPREGKISRATLGLYISHKTPKGWSLPIPFPHNHPKYSLAHASFGPGDSVLYFSSDLPGGAGGTDIWQSTRVDTVWEQPIPLVSINTQSDESYPFFVSKGILLFASKGHVGLGGLDIFAARIRDEKWGKIRNLGSPVNSHANDFALVTDSAMQHGYFSSDRPSYRPPWKKSLITDTLHPRLWANIYELEFLVPFDFGRTLYGQILDEDGKPVEGVHIDCRPPSGGRELRGISGKNGVFEIALNSVGTHYLKGSKLSYFEKFDTLEVKTGQEDYNIQLVLKRDPNISFRLYISEGETGEPSSGVTISMLNLASNEEKQITTDETGHYQEYFPKKGLQDSLLFRFILEKPGYLTKVIDFKHNLDHLGVYEVHKIRTRKRRYDLTMRRKTLYDDLALQLGILPYFYGTDKTQIEPDNLDLLHEIGQTLANNPGLKIEIINHTDCRPVLDAKDDRLANLELSKARAKAIYLQLTLEFPDLENRITHQGVGDAESKSECSCYRPRSAECDEVDHQIDRRTDFIITALD